MTHVCLALVFAVAAVGLFVPDDWHGFLFALLLVLSVVGLYRRPDEVPASDDGWVCADCGAINAAWCVECPRCTSRRRMERP
jgi:hypothetical protein